MSQHDYVISDQDGASFLVDLLNLAAAIVTQNSGDTEPATTYPHMFWMDTSADKIKQRNEANNAWIEIGDLGAVGWGKLARSGGAMAGVLQLDASSDIASGATVDLGSATGNDVTITHSSGTTAITGFGGATAVQKGARIRCRVSLSGGTLTITYNATSMKIPGLANLSLVDGMSFDAVKISDSNAYWAIENVTKPDGTAIRQSSQAFLADCKNLIITNNSGTPNSQLDIDADEVTLKDSNGLMFIAAAVNLTANIASSGANGLDTGSEASGTWYYAWVIYNGTTVASLLSTSSTAPTMPSGYTYKALVGAIYNDESSNFIKYYQAANEFWVGEVSVTTTVPSTSYVSRSLAAAVPPIAKSARISAQWTYGASATGVNYYAPSAADHLAQKDNISTGSGTATTLPADHLLPMITPQTMYYKRTGTAAASGDLYCNGGRY